MIRICEICVICGLLLLAGAAPAAAPDKAPPVLPPAAGLAIRTLQLEQAKLEIEIQKAQIFILQASAERGAKLRAIAEAAASAHQQAGADPDKWDFSADTLTFTKKPESGKN